MAITAILSTSVRKCDHSNPKENADINFRTLLRIALSRDLWVLLERLGILIKDLQSSWAALVEFRSREDASGKTSEWCMRYGKSSKAVWQHFLAFSRGDLSIKRLHCGAIDYIGLDCFTQTLGSFSIPSKGGFCGDPHYKEGSILSALDSEYCGCVTVKIRLIMNLWHYEAIQPITMLCLESKKRRHFLPMLWQLRCYVYKEEGEANDTRSECGALCCSSSFLGQSFFHQSTIDYGFSTFAQRLPDPPRVTVDPAVLEKFGITENVNQPGLFQVNNNGGFPWNLTLSTWSPSHLQSTQPTHSSRSLLNKLNRIFTASIPICSACLPSTSQLASSKSTNPSLKAYEILQFQIIRLV